MNPGLYFRYSTRSLARDGYRTVLAIFCIAVGVMAIVSLQLAGLTIRHSLTSNVREANGGDIQMMAVSTGLSQDELSPRRPPAPGAGQRLDGHAHLQRHGPERVQHGAPLPGPGRGPHPLPTGRKPQDRPASRA